jgi:hypothetical protein
MKKSLQLYCKTLIAALILFGSIFFLGTNPNPVEQNDSPPPFFQPDRWCSNFPSLPGSGAIFGHASCVLGDTLYVAGGNASGGASMDFVKYSISGNAWHTAPTLPGPKAGGDLVAAGGKIYYIGGGNLTYTTGTPEQYVYTPYTGQWTTIANIPTPVTGCVAECYNDSLIYCIAGGWDTFLTTVQVYRISTNTWTTATSLPTGKGRRSFAGGLDGNKIYVACGYSNNFRNDFLIGTINPANPLNITWANGPNLAINSSRPGGTAINGRFYVVLGETTVNQNGNDSMAIWDTTSASWTYKDGKPLRASNYWGVVSASFVYCAGRPGIKIWVPAGSYNTTSSRPLDVFSDTCMTGCITSLTGLNNNNNEIPRDYALKQNFPNPFNPVTKINYELPITDYVKLVIYDMLGKQVSLLVDKEQLPGIYNVLWDASDYPSGVYFYSIETGKFKDTKKMVLVK